MALLGFSGVASAFAGRLREYDLVDRMRLNAIVFLSGMPLAGSLLLVVLGSGGVDARTAVASAAVLSFLVVALGSVRRFPAFFRAARDPDTTTETALVASIATAMAAAAGLFLLSALLGGVLWCLLAGYSIQLLVGVVVFARLLNRAN